jgi:hypothetical protein
MPVRNLFSKREKRKRGEIPDIFQYTDLTDKFRVQIIHILEDVFELIRKENIGDEDVCELIHNSVCREHGWFSLDSMAEVGQHKQAIFNFIVSCKNYEHVLDVIELSFAIAADLDKIFENDYHRSLFSYAPEKELNERFLENGIGYQFEAGQIVRVDSQIIHSEVTKPVLNLLSEDEYEGANEEYLKAHEHFRAKRYKECMNECLKSFESVMKAICAKRGWSYDASSDTAKKLLDICFKNGLIPVYLQNHFASLRTSLESGVPTLRNKNSGHGQGEVAIEVPSFLASYMLNLTGTSILMLISAEKELK